MTVETFSPSDVIRVTASAQTHFLSQLQKTGKLAIRVSLKESGCTGNFYRVLKREKQAFSGALFGVEFQ